jgi:hypothetical protein
MTMVAPSFAPINLIFALLRRWLGLWLIGPRPPARFVALLERTEARLAGAIRATLAEDGVAFPTLDDPAFLKWFAEHAAGMRDAPGVAMRRRRASGVHRPAAQRAVFVSGRARTGNGPRLDRPLPAGMDLAGRIMPAGSRPSGRARAPP